MDEITFEALVDTEQVIRPPADVVLPEGPMEVTVRPVRQRRDSRPMTREEANARLRQCRVSIGRETGIDNEGIDADLVRAYANADQGPK